LVGQAIQDMEEQQEKKLAFFKNGSYIKKVNLALTLVDILFKLEQEAAYEEKICMISRSIESEILVEVS